MSVVWQVLATAAFFAAVYFSFEREFAKAAFDIGLACFAKLSAMEAIRAKEPT